MKKIGVFNKEVEQLYVEITGVIEDSRSRIFRAGNISMVRSYWEIGRLLVEVEQKGEDRAAYGEKVLEVLSARLQTQYGKGYTETNLRYMRLFYKVFEIRHALRDQLSWTHYRLLLKVEKKAARLFYMDEAVAGNWNTRTLEKQINNHYYERMLLSSKEGRIAVKEEADLKKETITPADIIKDPYLLDFLGLKQDSFLYEKELEQALIDKLQDFLLELGKGFCFVTRQYRITTEDSNRHFHIDLVFYNYILKCFLLIDLKTTELNHGDIGQMDFYVRYFEDKMRQPGDNPTIGLILCTEKDRTVVKYSPLSDGKQLFASTYRYYLPSDEELRRELERGKREIEMEKRLTNFSNKSKKAS
ncbi:MAG TPA: PDDEXK nuclease domain-containing protein [Puia sp.]|jgi:predicted nuclease of restriction endonuclease-like (RecB) superfamily|nr:PDDEXK nuclease domain-containing protein [Puia sp.]